MRYSTVYTAQYDPSFGMVMPGRSYTSSSGDYRFGFNGMEKDGDVNGTNNTYTTHFRMLDTRLGRWFSADPIFQPSYSPYSAMDNNPMFYTDVLGDSVNVSNTYDKGNEAHAEAFELFAATEEGREYILDRAQKGFVLEGKYVEGLRIEATEDGSMHKNGIDVTFAVKDLSSAGLTEESVKNNRLKLTFSVNKSNSTQTGTPFGLLDDVGTYAHESMYHGEYIENQFFQFQKGLVNLDVNGGFSSWDNSLHKLNLKETAFGKNGLSILKQAQSAIQTSNVATNYYIIANIEKMAHSYGWSCQELEGFLQRVYKPIEGGLDESELKNILLDGLPRDNNW